MALRHNDLCFGCGRTNLFGLLAEIEGEASGAVSGRCFIKQDHQGPRAARAHPGVVAAALIEAMVLCAGPDTVPARLEVSFQADAPVGTFLELEAQLADATDSVIGVTGQASCERLAIACAVGSFTRATQLRPTDP